LSLKITDLTKVFGEQKALDEVNFTINKGEIVGFLGPNGAGKSTTMKIISCYMLPTSGNVELDNYNIYEHSLEIRKKIGYLPEHNPLYEDMFIKEYLQFTASILKLSSAEKKIKELIDLTGLSPEINKKIGALSKGYRQRVGLAQALLHNPELLILDEPTSGLDPNQIIDIRNLIKEIGKEKTVILSTHIMQEVQIMCNRVIIINKGNIVADDSTENLLKISESDFQFYVEFNKNPDIEKLKTFEQITDVVSFQNGFKIFGKQSLISETIFDFAVQNQLKIKELRKESGNLESIFQNLTISQNTE
jgi:ABC-2 type transport system ATP-binding protein